ncbi:hypothetical protein EDB86DRAFT_2826044 [Lactarius hatsudake]|nr:hypothetical protein EDB86DRAFT_2826044 [Lactarius hatsudake]
MSPRAQRTTATRASAAAASTSSVPGMSDYEPREGAERDEAVEVPRGVVRKGAPLPLELVGPCAKLFELVFVRRFWEDCNVNGWTIVDGEERSARSETNVPGTELDAVQVEIAVRGERDVNLVVEVRVVAILNSFSRMHLRVAEEERTDPGVARRNPEPVRIGVPKKSCARDLDVLGNRIIVPPDERDELVDVIDEGAGNSGLLSHNFHVASRDESQRQGSGILDDVRRNKTSEWAVSENVWIAQENQPAYYNNFYNDENVVWINEAPRELA